MLTFRNKIDERVKQIKSKLRGYVYVSYTKKECPRPKTVPVFPEGTPPVLMDLYSEYEFVNLETTQGSIYIPPFNQLYFNSLHLTSYEKSHLTSKYDSSFLDNLVILSKFPYVVYHNSDEKIYLVKGLHFLPLKLTIQEYFDWQIFFLGIYNFQYFFVEKPEEYKETLKIVNQSLNFSFYKTSIIPEWFKYDIPELITIYPSLEVGSRVKEFGYDLSGVITEIDKTKAVVQFDAGFSATKMVRNLVQVVDSIYEDLISGKKNILSLSPHEFKNLAECCYSRREYMERDTYSRLSNLYVLNALYKNIPLNDIFREGVRVIKELNIVCKEVQNPNDAADWDFTRQIILGGMYVACFWYLQSNDTPNLSEALQAPLHVEVKKFLSSEEKRDEDILNESPIGYFKQAYVSWNKSDFDDLRLDAPPQYFE